MSETEASSHVVIVDDEPKVLEILCDLVRSCGYRVSEVTSARDAVQILKEDSVDLVLTDLMMPEINGWQLLRTVKRTFPDLPVVVLTGFIPEQGETILTERKADGYLTKPVDKDELVSLLGSLLAGRKLDTPPEVVVLDDDAGALATLEHVLTRDGLQVFPFQDIGRAMDHVREQPPDLVTVDLNIPNGSGFDLVESIRAEKEMADIPIIVVTAEPSRENVKRAIELRVNGFVSKPFDARSLGEKVRQVLRQAGVRMG